MIRKLLIVFASGLVLSIVALSAAWVIGGRDFLTRIHHDGHFTWDDDDDKDRPRASRSLAFDVDRLLTVDVPVSLEFVRGDKVEMTVSGPARMVNALRWENGTLSLASNGHHRDGLRVRITAPRIAGLVLTAPGDIELNDLDQPMLRLDVRGPAEIDASGRVDTVDINARGVGSIDLTKLKARDAKADIKGVGSIDLDASGTVEADISGAGSVVLHRKPAVLTTRTSGIGSVEHDY